MNRILYLFVFITVLSNCITLNNAQESRGDLILNTAAAAGNTTTANSYYLSPTVLENYNPKGCGVDIKTPCSSFQDAIYSFLNETTPIINNTMIINLLPGVFFNSSTAYGINDTMNTYGLDVTIQSWDPVNNVVATTPSIIYGRYISTPIAFFLIERPTSNSTEAISNLAVNNVVLDSFRTTFFYTTVATNFVMNNCTTRNTLLSISSFGLLRSFSYGGGTNNLTISNSNFTNNVEMILTTYQTFIQLNGNQFTNNSGQQFYIQNNVISLVNNLFDSNQVSPGKYCSRMEYVTAVMNNTIVSNNNGGNGMFIFINSYIYVDQSKFINNQMPGYSTYGPLAASYCYTTSISNSQFINNYAYYGSGVYSSNSLLQIQSSNFTNNVAGTFGSQLYVTYRNARIVNSNFYSSNSTGNPSSLIYFVSTSATIYNTTMGIGNAVMKDTSFTMVYCSSSSIYYSNVTMQNNGYNNIKCTFCSSYNQDSATVTNTTLSPLYCKSSSSSSSNDPYRPHSYSPYRTTYIVLICFFSGLLFIAIVIILACLVKQRKRCHDGYNQIETQPLTHH